MKFNLLLILSLAFFLLSCENKIDVDEGQLVPKTVLEDPSLPHIKVNNVLLHSETFGDPTDPIILVLHGGPGADYKSMLSFKQFADDGYFVVFYDQMGSGLSERLENDHYVSVQQYIDELDGVIKLHRLSSNHKVVLAGHSWGAMLAAAYINQNPNEIDGAIFIEPGGFTWQQTEQYFTRSRKIEIFNELTNDLLFQDQILSRHGHEVLDYKLALTTAGNATGDTGMIPYWRYGGVCNLASLDLAIENPEEMNFTTNLNKFNVKTLFVYSEKNSAYGIEHAQLVSSSLNQTTLHEIKNCGHEIPTFGWIEFYPIGLNYLNTL